MKHTATSEPSPRTAGVAQVSPGVYHTLHFVRTARFWLWVATACLLTGGLLLVWRGAMPFERTVEALARMDAAFPVLAARFNLAMLRHYYATSVGVVLLIAGALLFGAIAWLRLAERTRWGIYRQTVTVAASCALLVHLLRTRAEAPWLPISLVMHDPAKLPIIGHRLLFVWVADGFAKLFPGLPDLQCFYCSQALAIVLAVFALGAWSALHIGRSLSWLGQVLGVLLIATCLSYYNFCDIGHVFFVTCGLIAIYTRRYWALVPVMLIGTLNYEGLLLLIPVAAFAAYDERPLRRWLPPLSMALVAYLAVRAILQFAIPFSSHVEWRIWSNLTDIFVNGHELALSMLALAGWWVLGLMSWGDCAPRLRRLVLLFPLVFGVTFLAGQFHEPRQFDAFIPVLVAMILSSARRRIERDSSLLDLKFS